MPAKPSPASWFGTTVKPDSAAALSLVVSESYLGTDVTVPVHVWRGKAEGPTVCITAAVHGDEINGTGAIRHIIRHRPFHLSAGTLVLVPVVNVFGFDRHTRYLPDRRDLNRSFPGSSGGSLAGRFARLFLDKITRRCEFGIDLHTASLRRTNFPNVRADLSDERLAGFARAFGAELIVKNKGPKGSLREQACKLGCATLILEAGEVWKVESSVVEYAVRGITNCLRHLNMVEGKPREPGYRVETDATHWVRAKHGGFLEFHVAPGDIVGRDEPIATNTDLAGGQSLSVIRAPRDGIVLGMTTIPCVAPGDPVCHLAYPSRGAMPKIERAVHRMRDDSLHERIRDDLARNVRVIEPKDHDAD